METGGRDVAQREHVFDFILFYPLLVVECVLCLCVKSQLVRRLGGGQHVAQIEHAFDVFVVLCFDVFVCTFDVSVRSGGGQAGCGTKRTRF